MEPEKPDEGNLTVSRGQRNQLVALLSLLILGAMAIGGSIAMSMHEMAQPAPLTALGGACIGGLATFVALKHGDK